MDYNYRYETMAVIFSKQLHIYIISRSLMGSVDFAQLHEQNDDEGISRWLIVECQNEKETAKLQIYD